MEEISDVKALEKISSEVDESQIKVILSSQCIKAQAFLHDKLRRLAERHKESCNYISSANLKLEAEIKHADQEIRSAIQAQDTIKSSIIELKKEWMLAKEKKAEVAERITESKKKYEALWMQCKTRYESIPFVQNLLRAQDKVKALKNDIGTLDKGMITLYEDMKKQKQNCIDLDRKRCIELAHYMVEEMPKLIKCIEEKQENINNLTKQIEELLKVPEKINVAAAVLMTGPPTPTATDNVTPKIKEKSILSKLEHDPLIPKLKLRHNINLDNLDNSLNEVKINKDVMLNSISAETDFMENYLGKRNIGQSRCDEKAFDYIISPYFKPYREETTYNYAKRKLINILEDVHINNNEAYNIVNQVNLENLRSVNEISSEMARKDNIKETPIVKDKANSPIESDIIEEIDMTSNAGSIIVPPTQFLDVTLTETLPKKRVAMELTPSPKINEIIEEIPTESNTNALASETMTSQMNISAESDESFMKIKDMLLKTHDLDLTPEFVYAKAAPKKDDDKIITSKFFQKEDEHHIGELPDGNKIDMDEQPSVKEAAENRSGKEDNNIEESEKIADDNSMDVDEPAVTSPKEIKAADTAEADMPASRVVKSEHPTSGLLFAHGTQGIPDSLNVSMSTTGYEETDFPYCIDSSLLLSPKGDIPLDNDNKKVTSQEVPNFLSGFRKAGISFFGGPSKSESKPEDSAEDAAGNNFSFNFGGEKKNRGGLFSFFQ